MTASPAPAPRAARRSQAERRAQSERLLLAAAAEIIASEGYAAATLARVGERAGFSRALASRKFGSKDGLIEAVIRHVSETVHARIDRAIGGIASPRAALVTLVDTFVALVLSDSAVRAYFVLFSAMIANRLGTRPVFQAVQQRYGERLGAIVAAGQAAGEIDPGIAPEVFAFLLGCLQAGMAIEVTMGADGPTAAARAGLATLLARALGPGGDQR